jgi:tetratricopeptide (TPR) repeat protein
LPGEKPRTYREMVLGEAGATYAFIGECFLLADRPQQARTAFEQSHKLTGDRAALELNLARLHLRAGEHQQALAALENAFAHKLAAKTVLPYQLLADIMEKLGRADDLIPRLEKLRADDTENLPLAYFLADRFRTAEQWEKAASLYRELLEKKPSVNAYRGLAEIYRRTKDFSRLLAVVGEAVEKTGTIEALGAEAGNLATDADAMLALAQTAQKMLRDDPQSIAYGMRLALALLAVEGKRWELADEFFEAALKAKPKEAAEVMFAWGIGLLVAERPAEAVKVFRRAVEEKVAPEDDARFYFHLAGALAAADQHAEALAAARKAIEKKPDGPRFHARVGWIHYHAKQYDEAIRAYEHLLRAFGGDHESAETREVVRESRLVLSHLHVLKNQFPQAEEYLEQVLDEFPDDPSALNDLGYLWADQNKHLGRARRMIERAVNAEPENAAFRDSLGWVLYRQGRFHEAVKELEKAAAAREDGVILEHLGDAYVQCQQWEKAEEAYRRAYEAFEKEKELDKAKKVEEKRKRESEKRRSPRCAPGAAAIPPLSGPQP